MAITIKNAETESLSRELAQLSGETITKAITVAVRDRLELLRTTESEPSRTQRLLAIGRSIAPALRDGAVRSTSIEVEDLYDEQGLPA